TERAKDGRAGAALTPSIWWPTAFQSSPICSTDVPGDAHPCGPGLIPLVVYRSQLMKILKKILIALAVLIGVLVLVGFVLPGKYQVSRSVDIKAPPEK